MVLPTLMIMSDVMTTMYNPLDVIVADVIATVVAIWPFLMADGIATLADGIATLVMTDIVVILEVK